MRFEKSAKDGRLLTLLPEEKVCKWCKEKKSQMDKWYYLDHNFSKGLYCYACASDAGNGIPLSPMGGQRKCQFWLIDRFKYGSGEE